MPMRPRLWSLSGLAVELGVNVRTLAARLKHTKSDGKVGGNPAWFMTTAMEAMQGDRPDNNVARDKIGVELELIARDLQAGLAQMRSEPKSRPSPRAG